MKIALSLTAFFIWVGVVRADDNRFWLDGEINGHPARLSLDTGAETSGIYPEAGKRLGLEVDLPAFDFPPSEGKVFVGWTKETDLKLPHAPIVRTSLAILPHDLSPYDTQYDGLVGWPQVNGNVLLIEAATLTAKPTKQMPGEAVSWIKFRVLTNYNFLALEIPGTGTNKLVVVIDTGMGGGLTIGPERWRQWKSAHPRRPKSLTAYNMLSVGNALKEESWADNLAIGSLVLTDVPVMEADKDQVAASAAGYAATLGMAALKRLDLVVDGTHNFAYVRPKQTPPAPYQHNRLGAIFVPKGPQDFQLSASVAPDSPAYKSGIRDGDILLRVGVHNVSDLSTDKFLLPLILTWDRPAGTQFVLTLMRGSRIFRTTVALQDILKPKKTLHPPAKILASEVHWLTLLGESCVLNSDYDPAIANFTEALRLKPGTVEAVGGLGVAYQHKGSNDLALADLNIAIQLKPDYAEAYNNRATLWQNAWHDTPKALADYTVAIRLNPNFAEAYRNRGTSHKILGEIDKAMADFNEAIRLYPSNTQAILDRGATYEEKGDYDLALSDASEAVRLKPDSAEAFKLRGSLFLLKNNYEAAITNFNEVIRLDPTNFEALNNRGVAYQQTGAFDLAVADLTKALRLNPDCSRTLFARGVTYFNMKEYDHAIEDYSKAITLDPKDATAIFNRANSYFDVHDYVRALADYTAAARSFTNDPALFKNRGLTYESLAKYDEAIADFTESIRLDAVSAPVFGYRGNAYENKKDYPHAIADYERAIQLKLSDPYTFIKLAHLLAACPVDSLHDGKKAVQYAQKACDLNEWKDADYVDILAMACAANSDFADAVKWEQTFLACSNLPEDVRSSAQKRLALYQQHKSYRETD